jgi:hypothetical protein
MALPEPQARVLGVLSGEPLTFAEIRARTGLSEHTARTTVHALAYLGWARRRDICWHITGGGQRIISQPVYREFLSANTAQSSPAPAGELEKEPSEGERVEYNPGADGASGDTYNEDPLGADAPKRRISEDPRVIKHQD